MINIEYKLKKKQWIFVSIIIIGLVFLSPKESFATNLQDNLKAYWDFNDKSGNFTNQAGTIYHSTASLGKFANLINTTDVKHNIIGKVNNATNQTLSTSRISNHWCCDTDTRWNFMFNETANFTYAGWYRQEKTGQDIVGLFGNGAGGGILRKGIGCALNVGDLAGKRNLQCFASSDPNSFYFNHIFSNVMNDDTNWHFIGIEYSANATNNLKILIDGSHTFTTSTVSNAPNDPSFSNHDMNIGNNPSFNWGFNGTIDESYIWNRQLSAVELEKLYNGGYGYNPTTHIILTPNKGPKGSSVQINGTGFCSLCSTNLYYDGVFFDQILSNNVDGSFSKIITIPQSTLGIHVINATGQEPAPARNAVTTFNVTKSTPHITLNPINGKVGTTVSTSGYGFVNNAPLRFKIDSSVLSTNPGLPQTDNNGNFTNVLFTIPKTVAGHHNINVTDGYNNNATAILNVTSSQQITPTSGIVGTTVTVNGYGFSAGNNQGVTNATKTIGDTSANENGFVGDVWVVKMTGLPANANINLAELDVNICLGNQRVKIYSDDGASNGPGTLLGESSSIACGGTNFRPYPISALVGASGNIYIGFETDSNIFSIYKTAAGGTGYFVGHVYGSGPNPFGTPDGTSVRLFNIRVTYSTSGSSMPINIKFDGKILATSTTNTNGTFVDVKFKVPSSTVLGHIVNSTEGSHSATSIFTTIPGLSISPSSGSIGNTITLNGSGFSGSSQIHVYFGNNLITTNPPFFITNATGSFNNIKITVPNVQVGNYNIQAVDSASYNAAKSFSVTPFSSNAPDPVSDLHTTFVNDTSIGLAWTQPNLHKNILSGYQINYTTPFGIPNIILTNNTHSSNTAFTITGINPNTEYSFRVGIWTTNSSNPYGNILNVKTSSGFIPQNFTIGKVGTTSTGNINASNPLRVPIQYIRQDFGTTTILKVIYPNNFNLSCNFNYEFAQINRTYTNLPVTSYEAGYVQSVFDFNNTSNEVIQIDCIDKNTNTDGKYVLTQTNFPIIQQVNNFRNGTYGTHGGFGAFDLITLVAIIASMIGLNRISESVGAIFTLIIIGVLAFFQIIQWPSVVISVVALGVMLAVTQTRKT